MPFRFTPASKVNYYPNTIGGVDDMRSDFDPKAFRVRATAGGVAKKTDPKVALGTKVAPEMALAFDQSVCVPMACIFASSTDM